MSTDTARKANRSLTRSLVLMVAGSFAFGFGLSQLLFVYIIIKCARGGTKATDHVWEGAYNHGLEWTVPSPAPYHTFDEAPVVK